MRAEHGFMAFLGDPFGDDVIAGNLVLSPSDGVAVDCARARDVVAHDRRVPGAIAGLSRAPASTIAGRLKEPKS